MTRTAAATAARLAKQRAARAVTPLELARVARGWTQQKLADKTGVSIATVRKLEDGSAANTRTLERLAEPLGVKPAYLAGWE